MYEETSWVLVALETVWNICFLRLHFIRFFYDSAILQWSSYIFFKPEHTKQTDNYIVCEIHFERKNL